MRLDIDAPYPRDQIANVIVWTSRAISLAEDWLITVKHAPTDWAYDHPHGVAHPDQRGVVLWIPRSFEQGAPIQDVWSFIVYITAHELTHCAQHERDFPGSSQSEPMTEVEVEIDHETRLAAIAASVEDVTLPNTTATENAEATRQVVERLREESQHSREEDEREALVVGQTRLLDWHELSLSERDAVRFGVQQRPLGYWG